MTTTRRVRNVTGQALWVRPAADVPDGSRISVSPRRLRVPAGGTGTFTIALSSRAPLDAQQFGSVRFRTARGTARIPVAFVRTPGDVRLDQSCGSDSVRPGRSTWCTVTASNTGREVQDVVLSTTSGGAVRTVDADGASVSGGRRPTVSLSRTLRGAELGVPTLAPGQAPGPGFLDLAAFGVAPQAIGDEELQVYRTPSFRYNGQTYSGFSVDSNGYLVVGGDGSSDENECCLLPSGCLVRSAEQRAGPVLDRPARHPAGRDPGCLPGGRDRRVDRGAVGRRRLRDRCLRRFQVWIGAADDGGPAQDVFFAYDDAMADPHGQLFLVGAENSDGQGDLVATRPDGEDRVVTSSDPAPGDTASYRVRVAGTRPGTGVVHTDLEASRTRGTTTADTTVRVR